MLISWFNKIAGRRKNEATGRPTVARATLVKIRVKKIIKIKMPLHNQSIKKRTKRLAPK